MLPSTLPKTYVSQEMEKKQAHKKESVMITLQDNKTDSSQQEVSMTNCKREHLKREDRVKLKSRRLCRDREGTSRQSSLIKTSGGLHAEEIESVAKNREEDLS